MANNDPTAILSSIVAVPFSILGTSLQEFVSTAWNMGENAKAAEEALEMTLAMGEILVFQNSSVVQNKGKEKVEQVRSALDDAKGASSSTSWNPFHRFIHSRRISKARNELEGFRSTAILAGVQNIQKSLQGQENASCLASLAYFTCLPVPTAQPVVGISDLVSRLQSTLLDGNSPQWISVTGAGGMGKSFLVRIVCNTQEVRDHFGDVLWVRFSHDCQESDQLRVQSNLFVRLSGQQTVGHFMTLSSGNDALQALIVHQQQRKPYLLVLDNVWSRPVLENFDFLRGSDGSKVIVTSRYQDILSHTDRTVIDMDGLSVEDAYQLFCKHAFNGTDSAPAELEDHVRKFIGHCSGNPLMLEVLGKFMRRRRSLPGQWEFVLLEIERRKRSHEVHEHVFQILRLSYDVLDDMDKKRFLFLASTAGYASLEDSEMIFYCWRGLHFLSYDDNMEMAKEEYNNALERLCSSSLVFPWQGAPDIIRQLAEYIIWKDNLSHSTGYRTSFYKTESGETLPQSPLSVGMMSIDGDDIDGDDLQSLLQSDYFNHFPNLQALQVRYGWNGLRAYIPLGLIQLRYLHLHAVVLDVSMATALCESLKHLARLEYLSIHGTAAEEIILDLGFLECMPNLTQLLVDFHRGGVRLINSHHIQNLRKLEKIELPTFEDWDLQRLKHLEVITITGTTKDITPPPSHSDRFLSSLSTCTRLQQLVLDGVAFNRVPAEIHWPHLTKLHLEVAMQCLPNTWLQSLPRLEELRLNGGGMLVEHPPFDKLPRLRSLVLSKLAGDHISFTPEEHPSLAHFAIENCVNLVELPALEKLPELKRFKVQGCAIQQFPEANVEDLKIIDCKKLIRLPSPMPKVSTLVLCGLTSLEWSREASFPSLQFLTLEAGTAFPLGSIEAPNLFKLEVSSYARMKHLPLIRLPSLKKLTIEGCAEMETILQDDTQFPVCFPNLQGLSLIELPKLVRVLPSTLIPLPSLLFLTIKGCAEMETILQDDTQLPVCFPNLQELSLIKLPKLVRVLSTLISLPKLERLFIDGCVEMETILQDDTQFPVCFPNLKRLILTDLPKLVRVLPSTLIPLPSLRFLFIAGCAEMETILQDDTQFPVCFPNLRHLSLRDLPKLVRVLPSTLIPLPSLVHLTIKGCAEMETILQDDTQFPVCFPNLRDLSLRGLPKLVRVPPTLPKCDVWL